MSLEKEECDHLVSGLAWQRPCRWNVITPRLAAVLTVLVLPYISQQPTNQSADLGGAASFGVVAGGPSPLFYQWSLNGTNLPGATNATLTLPNIQLNRSGQYTVTITNAYGLTNSYVAVLSVVDTLDHFAWTTIPSPRFVNTPFAVSVQAMDSINQIFTNFGGRVSFSSANNLAVSPAVSGTFTGGTWTGSIIISQAVSNLVLRANDGADGTGQFGLANPINVVPTPNLGISRSGGSLLIDWPASPSGFLLESSPTVAPLQWMPVSPGPVLIGGQYIQVLSISNTNQLFLLRFTNQ